MSEGGHCRARVWALVRLGSAIVVAGALTAGLLMPWVVAPGWVASRVASANSPLPGAVVGQPPVGNTRVLAVDGSLITEFYSRDRTPVDSDRIAGVMKQAQVDIEDSRFYQHRALDLQGTLRALVANVQASGVAQGGSTLTQQLVKQSLLQAATSPEERQAATADTLGRKLKEARAAIALESRYSKDELLTRYLNTVYYGHGAYGIQAAARTYFSTDAAHLSLVQAATLAGLVQAPAGDDPIDHPAAARERRDEVLNRMLALGHITAAQQASALAEPVQVQPGGASPHGCANATIGGFFCDYLQTYLRQTLHLSQQQLDDGGLTIRTTLRPDIQAAGDAGVLATLPMGSSLAGVYDVVQPGTGHVLAMSVNRRFGCTGDGCTSVNLGVAAGQGAGSTYKLFTAAAALEQGYTMSFTQTTPEPYVSRVYKNGSNPYIVSNALPNYPHTLDMAEALARSSNTYFVSLEDQLGSIEGPVRTAQKMGLFSLSNDEADRIIAHRQGSFTLGPEATSPLALASAYSTVAARGTQCDPTPVTDIADSTGAPVTGSDGRPVNTGDRCTPAAIPRGIADTLAQVLRADVQSNVGTGTRANIPGYEISAKTGTSDNGYSVTFVGSTPQYTAAVMVYNPVANQEVGGFGGDKGGQIWRNSMLPILAKQAPAPFPPADPAYLYRRGQKPPAPSCSFAVRNLVIPC